MFGQYKKIGIMKGGQLGRMLIQSCMNYDLHTYVLDSDPNSPCAHFCTDFTLGDALNFDDVYQFGKKVDLLTLEFENVNVDALKKLKEEGLTVHPGPDVIALIQDKGLQKQFFTELKIPTAEYVLVENKNEIEKQAGYMPCVQKLRRAGYDGRGVYKIKNTADLKEAFDAPSVLEKPVAIKKEISVMVARNESGDIQAFPAVSMEFNSAANILDILVAPADIPQNIRERAETLAKKCAQELNLVGILAVELFLTQDDDVLVNEISPRPHNSGHHTIEANITSQYDQHLRAVLGLPLGSTTTLSPAVMINLLGAAGHTGPARYEGMDKILNKPGVYVHLYGKEITKPMRKMGHITILDNNISQAKETAKWIKENVRVVA